VGGNSNDAPVTALGYPTVMVSGGFDPVHDGHLDLIEHAAKYGRVVVALNSDAWLTRKKGYALLPWATRWRILSLLTPVYLVIEVDDADGTVCAALHRYRPTYFANGGDRTGRNTPELAVCESLGIRPLFGIGGGKAASSSDLVRAAMTTVAQVG
jgi:D-beta-D-heptose 7-phosphate kinase/D-beta-D-heptose 1-phosphate adenosyltransferase